MPKQQFKKINQYTAIFEPDFETGGYVVTIPALPGCISEGSSFEEAQYNIKEAAELYLETMKIKHEKTRVDNGIVISPIDLGV